MRVLVTGGAGFIGFHVAKVLLARGDEVVVVDNLNDYYDVTLKKARLAQIQDRVTFYHLDISDFDALRRVFLNHTFDKICHLAAQAGVRYSLKNPFAYHKANNLGTLNVLELMREFNVKDLVFASSSSVYGGNTKIPFSVTDPVDQPISLYAATKKHTEHMAHIYHSLYGLNCLGLRFFTVYGPWGRPDMALFHFTQSIMDGKPIQVFNNGDHSRDFTFISDIVDGVLKSLDKVKGFEILNLGNNKPVELMHFISCIEKEVGRTAEKQFVPMQQGDVHKTYADIDRTKEVLGWEPRTTIEEGIHQFIAWYREYTSAEARRTKKKIAIVGLGYVGLPLAVALGKHFPVVGFDANEKRIDALQSGTDATHEVSEEELRSVKIDFTAKASSLKEVDFII